MYQWVPERLQGGGANGAFVLTGESQQPGQNLIYYYVFKPANNLLLFL
jgi:hypothetical protein